MLTVTYLGDADGGQILAHEFTKQYLAIDRHLEWQNKTHRPLPAKALPTKTFTTAGSMTFGGQTIETSRSCRVFVKNQSRQARAASVA